MKNIVLPTLLIGVTVSVILLLNAFKPGPVKKSPSPQPAISIEALTIHRQDFQIILHSQGIMEAFTQATLAAQVSGNVITTNPSFERGGHFSKGDILVSLDDRDYVAALKLAIANESKAKVSVQEEQARAQQAMTDWKRLGYDTQPSDFVARRPQVAAAQAELASAKAQVTNAQLDLSRTNISAPFDGRVIGDAIDIGNYVTPGTPLGKIVADKYLKVALPISASWRDSIKLPVQTTRATLFLPHNKNTHWQAEITESSADISSESRQLFIIAKVNKNSDKAPNTDLLIGDYVTATILGRTLKNVIVIPRSAINDGQYVWQVKNNKLYKKAVSIIWTDKSVAVLDSGLNEGDLINITPVGAIVSGTPITLLNKNHKTHSQPRTEPVIP